MSTQEKFSATTRHSKVYKTIHIVNEKCPLSKMKIPPTKSYLWNKGDSFNKIYFMVINISDSHSINDIINTLDNKIPIKKTHTHNERIIWSCYPYHENSLWCIKYIQGNVYQPRQHVCQRVQTQHPQVQSLKLVILNSSIQNGSPEPTLLKESTTNRYL